MKDYYAILGVPHDATAAQIKKAFRKAAKEYHPDSTGGDKAKEARFKEISEAYEVLGDPKKRAEYDAVRSGAAFGAGSGGFGGAGFDGRGFPGGFPDIDFSELFARMGARGGRRRARRSPLDDILGGGFGSAEPGGGFGPDGGFGNRGGFGQGSGFSPGGVEEMFGQVFRDAATDEAAPSGPHAELEVDFVEAALGGTRQVSLTLDRPCPDCGGSGGSVTACPDCGGTGMRRVASGTVRMAQTCPRCGGRGAAARASCSRCGGRRVIHGTEQLEVRIPAGVDDGSIIRLRGKGPARASGGGARSSDLLLKIKVRPHPRFRRQGADILLDYPITVEEAILGATVDVPTLDGTARVRIPPGTSSGQRFRLRGKGARRLGEEGRGDEYVRVEIVVPKEVDERTRELVRELGRRAPVRLER